MLQTPPPQPTSGSTPLGPHLEKEVWRRGGGDICDSSTPTHPEVGKKVGFSPPSNLPPKGGTSLAAIVSLIPAGSLSTYGGKKIFKIKKRSNPPGGGQESGLHFLKLLKGNARKVSRIPADSLSTYGEVVRRYSKLKSPKWTVYCGISFVYDRIAEAMS